MSIYAVPSTTFQAVMTGTPGSVASAAANHPWIELT